MFPVIPKLEYVFIFKSIAIYIMLRQMVLKVVHRLFIGVSCDELSRNCARSWSSSSDIFVVSAFSLGAKDA